MPSSNQKRQRSEHVRDGWFKRHLLIAQVSNPILCATVSIIAILQAQTAVAVIGVVLTAFYAFLLGMAVQKRAPS